MLEDVPTLVASLVAKSMVVRTGSASALRVLAPIRSVAAELADDGERQELRRRFVEWYASWAATVSAELRSADEERAAVAIAAEFDNLRAAHRIALEDGDEARAAEIVAALLHFAVHRFRFEVANWAEASLRRPQTPDHLRPLLHGLLGIRAWMRGELAVARWHADAGVAIEERLGVEGAVHLRLIRLAVAGYEQRYQDAYDEFQRRLPPGPRPRGPGVADRGARVLGRRHVDAGRVRRRLPDRPACGGAGRQPEQPDVTRLDSLRARRERVPRRAGAGAGTADEASDLARQVGNEWVLGLVKVSTATQYRRIGRIVDAAVALLECLDRWSARRTGASSGDAARVRPRVRPTPGATTTTRSGSSPPSTPPTR